DAIEKTARQAERTVRRIIAPKEDRKKRMALALPNATDHDGILNHGGRRGRRGRLGSRLTPPSTESTISIPSNISNLLMRAFALVLSAIATVGLIRDLGAQVQPPTGRGAVQTMPPRWI